MFRTWTHMLIGGILAGTMLLAAPALADSPTDETPAAVAPRGSIAQQLSLLAKLNAAVQGVDLATSLNHNRREWEQLSPDEREQFREKYRAWAEQNPQQQQEILRQFEEWIRIAGQRKEKYRRMNEWLHVVVESFTPEERAELQKLSSDERARRIVQRRDALVAAGKLALDGPTSGPAESDR